MEIRGELFAGDEGALEYLRRGEEPDPTIYKRVKIVHISDTHGKEMEILRKGLIPDGDILIHSGDMMRREPEEQHEEIRRNFNHFFSLLPHKYKIFVAGNNEYCLKLPKLTKSKYDIDNNHRECITPDELKHYPKDLIQQLLPDCIYLQDESKTIEGIRFYGTPWTSSCNMAFSARSEIRNEIFSHIPTQSSQHPVDILIAHMPCFGILDAAFTKKTYNDQIDSSGTCLVCHKTHSHFAHWGCKFLRDKVLQSVRPKLFLCGHVHDDNGFTFLDNILFVNSAMDLKPQANVINYYVKIGAENTLDDPPQVRCSKSEKKENEKKSKKEKNEKSSKKKSKKNQKSGSNIINTDPLHK